jgi:hypothetical protein
VKHSANVQGELKMVDRYREYEAPMRWLERRGRERRDDDDIGDDSAPRGAQSFSGGPIGGRYVETDRYGHSRRNLDYEPIRSFEPAQYGVRRSTGTNRSGPPAYRSDQDYRESTGPRSESGRNLRPEPYEERPRGGEGRSESERRDRDFRSDARGYAQSDRGWRNDAARHARDVDERGSPRR